MAISSTVRKAGPFVGNGVATQFSFDFKVFEPDDVAVIRACPLGVETRLVVGNYVIALNADQNEAPGGIVTLAAPLAVGCTLVLLSDVPLVQPVDVTNQGGFYPELLNDGLDRSTIQVQQVLERLGRAVTLPVTADVVDLALPAPAAGQLLGWAEGRLVNYSADDLGGVIAYGAARVDKFDGNGTQVSFALSASPGSQNNLRVSIDGVVQVPGDDFVWMGGARLSFVAAPPAGTRIVAQYQEALVDITGAEEAGAEAGAVAAQKVVEGKADADAVFWPVASPYVRNVLDRMREAGASVKDIAGGVGLGGNDTEAFLELFDLTNYGVRTIRIPCSSVGYRLTQTLEVKNSCRIVGEGTVPYVGAVPLNQPVTRGPGSWLHFDHAGEGIKFYGQAGQELSGGSVVGIGTIRNQPAPGAGWQPNANGFDMVFLSGDWWADDLMLWNPTNGILHDYAGMGRLEIGRVRGNPFNIGLQIDRCFDIARARDIHWWPFSGIHTSWAAWKFANLKGLIFKDVDHAMFGNYFSIGAKTAVELQRGADGGSPIHIQFDKVQADLFGNNAVYIEGQATGASVEIANLYGQAAVAGDGNAAGAYAGVLAEAPNSTVKVGIFQVNRPNFHAAIAAGAGSKIYIAQPTASEWNFTNNGATAFAAPGAGSAVFLGSKVQAVGGNGARVVDDTGRVSSDEWSPYSPTFGSASGSLSSSTATGRWNRKGDTVSVSLSAFVTGMGTAGGSFATLSLPIAAKSDRAFILTGQENGLTYKALIARVDPGSSQLLIAFFDNTYPLANGARLTLTGSYEAAPL